MDVGAEDAMMGVDEPIVHEGERASGGGIGPPDRPAESSVAISAQQPGHR